MGGSLRLVTPTRMSEMAQDNRGLRGSLPDYERPPVTEVAVGIQFEPLTLLAPHLGLYWSEVRSEFPTAQQQGALEPVIERFGIKRTVVPAFRMMDAPETPRCWLIDKSGDRLIQL